MIKETWEFLAGKKTYISGVLLALWSVLKAFKVVETTIEQDMAIYGLLMALMGLSIRHGMSTERPVIDISKIYEEAVKEDKKKKPAKKK